MTGGGGLVAGLALPPTRYVLDRVLPDPGEGPEEEIVRKGFFKIEVHTRTASGSVGCRVDAQGDPGYGATGDVRGKRAVPGAGPGPAAGAGGGADPATAMGSVLVDRLRAAGQTWEVCSGFRASGGPARGP